MQRYAISESLGDGTYGSVFKAIDNQTGQMVAVKKMKRKFHSWKECVSLREVQSLRRLCHKNIVEFLEVIREKDSSLYFVFEFMPDGNLYEYIKRQEVMFPVSKIRYLVSQVLSGLAFIHEHGYFHRDIKPENLLMCGDICKIGDFGLAREVCSLPPYTDYVSTRWYRAPEVLLRSPFYNSPIDLFAVGCILAELCTLQPLFPGCSEIDQIMKIMNALGPPTDFTWPDGLMLCAKMKIRFPISNGINFPTILGNIPAEVHEIMLDLLNLDPAKRPTAKEALNYDFFAESAKSERGLNDSESLCIPSHQNLNDDIIPTTPWKKRCFERNICNFSLTHTAKEEVDIHSKNAPNISKKILLTSNFSDTSSIRSGTLCNSQLCAPTSDATQVSLSVSNVMNPSCTNMFSQYSFASVPPLNSSKDGEDKNNFFNPKTFIPRKVTSDLTKNEHDHTQTQAFNYAHHQILQTSKESSKSPYNFTIQSLATNTPCLGTGTPMGSEYNSKLKEIKGSTDKSLIEKGMISQKFQPCSGRNQMFLSCFSYEDKKFKKHSAKPQGYIMKDTGRRILNNSRELSR